MQKQSQNKPRNRLWQPFLVEVMILVGCILALNLVSAEFGSNITDAHNFGAMAGGAVMATSGAKIYATQNVSVVYFEKDKDVTAVTGYVLYENGTVISGAVANFIGNRVTFSPYANLTKGKYYYLAVNSTNANYNWATIGATLPVTGTNINWIEGLHIDGSNRTNEMMNVQNVTTASIYYPIGWNLIDEIYNSTVFETSKQTFVFNISYNATQFTSRSGLFYYSGTSYSSVATGVENTSFLSSAYATPSGTNPFLWQISLTNLTGTYISNSTTINQVVTPIYFQKCNRTAEFNSTYLNITFKDEKSSAIISGVIPSATFTSYLENQLGNKTSTYTNNTLGVFYHDFCFNPRYKTINALSSISYSNTSYPQRTATFTGAYTNATTQKILYLLSSAEGLYVTFQVINNVDQPIEGVYVNATTSLGGSETIVGSGFTDAAGGITFWLNPDSTHTFSFSKSGYTTYTTSLMPTQSSYTINLAGGSISTVGYDFTKGISYSIYPKGSLLNNTNYIFNFTLVSSSWIVSEFGFTLRNSSDTLSTQSASANGGIVSDTVNTENSREIIMDYYWIITGNYTNASTSWFVYTSGEEEWSINNFFTDLKTYLADGIFGLDTFGMKIIIFLTIFVFIGIFSFKYGLTSSTAIMIMIFALVYVFDVVLNLIPIPSSFPTMLAHAPTVLVSIILMIVFIKEASS